MDRRLIRYYDRELRHLQTVAKEFAHEFPKIAGRLAIEDFPCVDPYVERLLEGFAFLAARVQLKLDAEFPRFTQNLLETVYPHYLAPTPSMCVVQLQPDRGEAGLADGYLVPRGTVLRGMPAKDMTACEFRTAHDVTLSPVEVIEAQYYTRDVGTLELARVWGAPEADVTRARGGTGVRAALRLRLRTTAGLSFHKIKLPSLTIYLRGADATPWRVYEQMLAHARGVIIRPVPSGMRAGAWQVNLGPEAISRVGFGAKEALLPYDARSFQGYRLLHEYFAFPARFGFVRLSGLAPALARCESALLDVIIPLSAENADLEGAIDAGTFALHCTPAVNLFPRRAERIYVSDRSNEFLVVPDRTKPLDYEVHSVRSVTGFGLKSDDERVFRPFYAATDVDGGPGTAGAYFATHRVPRALTERERRQGSRSSYAGGEVYVALVDAQAAPYSTDLKQLAIETMCTNRDLPLQMPVGKGKTDFALDSGAPVESVRVVAGPTPPRGSHAEGETGWRLISHLALNYLSLTDEDRDGDGQITPDEGRGAAALRALLRLYGDVGDPVIRKQIDGVRGVQTRGITRRVPTPGVVAFARGLEVTVTLDEAQFEGTGVFALGAVLEQFFARYVSMNSFTETVIRSEERGEIMRWAAKVGQRPVL
ncbi:MAG: type VI secretion system baseplate subunit TssF [Planctomycetota bacterium]|nr:type VI secretion system baseplate subunit TssF [Planctomycetota bacterium]